MRINKLTLNLEKKLSSLLIRKKIIRVANKKLGTDDVKKGLCTKYFGIHMDSNSDLKTHIDFLVKKNNNFFGLLY